MAIELVVEDGAGLPDATSYGAVEGFRQYWQNRGVDYSQTDDEVKAQLNEATEYINRLYPWRGIRFHATQALEFPRHSCYDDAGVNQSGRVPVAIEVATFVAAGHLLDGGDLSAPVSNIKSKTMGPISVSYGFGEEPVRLPKVERLVSSLVKPIGVMR